MKTFFGCVVLALVAVVVNMQQPGVSAPTGVDSLPEVSSVAELPRASEPESCPAGCDCAKAASVSSSPSVPVRVSVPVAMTRGDCPGGVCPLPTSRVRVVAGPTWTWPGDLATHLEAEHGVSAGGMSHGDRVALHDSLHNGGAATSSVLVKSSSVTYRTAGPVRRVFSTWRPLRGLLRCR